MSIAGEVVDRGQTDRAELTGLVYRFWLSFIQRIAEPHLTRSDGGEQQTFLDMHAAEAIEKATGFALSGTPPHKCGSFGRAALSVMRGDVKRIEPYWSFPVEHTLPPASMLARQTTTEEAPSL